MSLRDAGGGRVHSANGIADESPLCRLIDSVPEGRKRCRQCDIRHLGQGVQAGLAAALPMPRGPDRYCRAHYYRRPACRQHVQRASSARSAQPQGCRPLHPPPAVAGGIPGENPQAYWEAPYLDHARLDAAVELLRFFARYLCEARLTLRQTVARLQRPEITAAQQFIEDHYADDLTLAQVAAHVGLSPALSVRCSIRKRR